MNKFKVVINLVFIFLLFRSDILAQLKTFANPDPKNTSGLNLKSEVYKVSIIQEGKNQESFVYNSKTNFEKPEQQSDYNHWTTFECSGDVEVVVTKLTGTIGAAKVYPLNHKIATESSNNQLRFKTRSGVKLFIDIEGMEEHPLFIFVDPIEKNIPSKKDNNTIWFEAGKVHNVGLQYKVPNGKTVYVEGGAVVWGTFWCEDGTKKTTIRGKGIITTRSDERKPNAQNIPFCTVYGVKTDLFVDGITITDPVKFCILGRSLVETSNVKLFAWYHQTDGWGGGDNSWIDDSFMKVFDDNVKLYGNNQKATNLVIYQQHNGAPFQLSWGGQSGKKCIVENIDIVKCWVNKKGGAGNSALLNLRKGSDKNIENITVRNVRADQGLYQLIGIGNDNQGKVNNIVLENIEVNQAQFQNSYINNTNGSSISNIQLKNIKINKKCLTESDVVATGFELKELNISCF